MILFKIQIVAICSIYFFQKAVKAWIIARALIFSLSILFFKNGSEICVFHEKTNFDVSWQKNQYFRCTTIARKILNSRNIPSFFASLIFLKAEDFSSGFVLLSDLTLKRQ